MNLFTPQQLQRTQEVQHEQARLETRSVAALKNMLAYCQARVSQLNEQYDFLDFLSRQEADLYTLCRIWHRMERTGSNYHRFRGQCLRIQLELAQRRP
jgi:hypothetical protein